MHNDDMISVLVPRIFVRMTFIFEKEKTLIEI